MADGERVFYAVVPVYSDAPGPMPSSPLIIGPNGWPTVLPAFEWARPNKIHIVAVSASGRFVVDVCIANTEDTGAQVAYDDPCLA